MTKNKNRKNKELKSNENFLKDQNQNEIYL